MEKINVMLYGGKPLFGKGRERPLEADEIFCDRHEDCSYFKQGMCLRCRCMFGTQCKYGETVRTVGYTSRAKKYYAFQEKYKKDPLYGKLHVARGNVACVGDYLLIDTGYVQAKKKGDAYEIDSRFKLGNCVSWILKSEVTPELLSRILRARPRDMFGDIITDYQEKNVPDVLIGLKRTCPQIYNDLIREYPEYDREPNYIGKKAFVNSLRPGTHLIARNTEWFFDGECLIAHDFNIGAGSPWWMQGDNIADVKIKVNERMVVEITDNSMVDENTRFA